MTSEAALLGWRAAERELSRAAVARLVELLGDRVALDKYLAPDGFRPENTRIFVLKRLLSLQKENFLSSLENSLDLARKHFPLDDEVLLHAFVCYVMDCDEYFRNG